MSSGPVVDERLIAAVHQALAAVADPDRAPAMQAYMKSSMPFLGVPKPARTAALRPVWRAHPIGQRGRWQATIGALWDGASYREHRYAALDLLATKVGAAWHDRDLLPLLEHLIVTGAWWDYVDDIATHHVRTVLLADPATTVPVIRAWAVAPDLWLRRTALIAQVGAKDHTDLDLLAFVITANAADPHFFCRKAIGWALREYAWTDPDWVRSFVDQHEESLSPLSRAQALKNLTP